MARRRRRARRGTASIEFAFIFPVLVVMFVATAEFVSYMRAWNRLEQAATSAAQAGSRIEELNRAALEGIFATAQAVADPFQAWTLSGSTVRARTIISVVSNPTNGNVVSWTCSRGDAGLTARVAGSAALPAAFTVPRGQSVLVVEIVNTSAPWLVMAGSVFFGNSGPPSLRAYTVARPRSTEMSFLAGGCP